MIRETGDTSNAAGLRCLARDRAPGRLLLAGSRDREDLGPFPTLLDAVNDMQYIAEAGPEPGETLGEAEDEIGVADWTDPETGEPAEEQVPRIEEH